MERREILKVAAVSIASALSSSALAQGNEHEHHHHGSHSDSANSSIITTSLECIKTGEACLNHCLYLLGKGKKEMAGCATSVNEMLAICNALMKLASQDSKRLKSIAKLAADVCESCEKECRKHEKQHAECKACADACAQCLQECKTLMKA